MPSGTFYPGTSGDDGLRYGVSNLELTWNFAYLGRGSGVDYLPFVRYPNVTIAKNATINSAYIRFKATDYRAGSVCNVRFWFNDVDDAVAPSSYSAFDSLVKTSAAVDWNAVGTWSAGQWYNSIDISSLIQEIVNRTNWASGNAMMFIGDNNGGDDNAARRFDTYDKGSGYPELHVDWTAGLTENRIVSFSATVLESDQLSIGTEDLIVSAVAEVLASDLNIIGEENLEIPLSVTISNVDLQSYIDNFFVPLEMEVENYDKFLTKSRKSYELLKRKKNYSIVGRTKDYYLS